MRYLIGKLVLTHWLHLALLLSWLSGIPVHIGFQGNLDLWLENPLRFSAIAHSLWEPHFSMQQIGTRSAFWPGSASFYFWARTVGFVSAVQLLTFGPALEVAAFGCLCAGVGVAAPGPASLGPNLPFPLLAHGSLLWAGHLGWAVHAHSQLLSPLALLSFVGHESATSRSVLLTDSVHHHLALGCLWHLAGSFARPSTFSRASLHRQLALACFGLASVVFVVAHHVFWLPSAGFLHSSLSSCSALLAHHLWLASAFLVGAFVHFQISSSGAASTARGLASTASKASTTSGLSWVTLFLGFHTLATFSHNDLLFAFGATDKAQVIQPILAQSIQSCVGKCEWLYVLCPADFLVHHALALGLHTSLLILVKGALDTPGSLLHMEKRQHGFGFACDGPGRGGTCDISGWDAVYLGAFWLANTLGWLCFYHHWRSLASFDAFGSTGCTLCGWFRDYLWLNSGNLVNGCSWSGSNELAVLAWSFLLGHLIWATSFMLLVSWRGYWQELLECLLFLHLKSPMVVSLWTAGLTPVALSILQARCVGLGHFTLGLVGTFAAFLLSA
jgi:photosystem I P700 chlorophyll a apoprotein A2